MSLDQNKQQPILTRPNVFLALLWKFGKCTVFGQGGFGVELQAVVKADLWPMGLCGK